MGVAQVIYALAALAMTGILSFQFLLGSAAIRTRVYSNEILTQVSGVANEIIEDIGTRAFDNRTREDLYNEAPTSASELTASGDFGGVVLANYANCDSSCLDIDDYHGLTFVRNRDGIDFVVAISVRYVDPDNPEVEAFTQTYAKEVILTITNPNIYRFNNPDSLIQIEIGRVFGYFRTSS